LALAAAGIGALGLWALWRLIRTPEWRFACAVAPEARTRAAQEIYRKPDWRAQWFARRTMRHRDPAVANLGLELAARRNFSNLAPHVRRLYDGTEDPPLRARALRTLAQLDPAGFFELVPHALEAEHSAVRSAAAEAAGETGDNRFAPLLMTRLPSAFGQERRAILHALIALRAAAVLPCLVEELHSEETLDAGEALQGLIQITGVNHGLDTEAWKAAIERKR
jgi:hypothetical protein